MLSGSMPLSYGQQLVRIERFCAHGARPPVTLEAVRFPSLPIVIDYFRQINGVGAPRGQLPSDHRQYVTSPVTKAEASVVVSFYDRLQAAGLIYADALLGAYRQYRQLYGQGARLDINRAWHVLRCLAIGRLVRQRCTHADCGAMFIEDADVLIAHTDGRLHGAAAGAEERDGDGPGVPGPTACPCCAQLRCRRGGVRISARQGVPSVVLVRLPDLQARLPGTLRVLEAEALCAERVRMVVVQDLTRLQNRTLLQRIYREQTGGHALSGPLPSDHRRYVRYSEAKLQASVAHRIHATLRKHGFSPACALLATQARCLDLFGAKAKFDITDLWGLVRAARTGRLLVHRCDAPGCGTEYLEDASSLITARSCPVCALSRQSALSRRRGDERVTPQIPDLADAS
jgi:hypothetical protein